MPRRYYSNTSVVAYVRTAMTTSTTSITVADVAGGTGLTASAFPATAPFFAVIDLGTASEEVVLVTAVSGATLTVIRAGALGASAYGSVSRSHSVDAPIVHVSTAADFDEANEHIQATNAVHGLVSGSAVVGTNDAQTLANKILASPVVTGVIEAEILRLTSTGDVNLTGTTHALQIGADSSFNIRIDNNEIAALNNGAGSTLVVQPSDTGGWLTLGSPRTTAQGELLAPKAMQSGYLTVTPVANTSTAFEVTFPTPFNSTPGLSVAANTGTTNVTFVGFSAVSTTGFTGRIVRSNTTATGISWIAVA